MNTANIIREYGPFPETQNIHGVSHDGSNIWFANGQSLVALDPDQGKTLRKLDIAGDAGTAYDGKHLYQLVNGQILKLDPHSGDILASIPAPEGQGNSGLAWAEGSLWLGRYKDRKIYEIDPSTGKILQSLDSNRHVTGVTWVDGELWHATWEDGSSEIRQVDPHTGHVLMSLQMPAGKAVSGLTSGAQNMFYCGGGQSGMLRAVEKPPSPFENDGQ